MVGVMSAKFKVGDKVRILPREEKWRYEAPIYLDHMTAYSRDVATIEKVYLNYSPCRYWLKETNKWAWNENWLEPITEEELKMSQIEEISNKLKEAQALVDKLKNELEEAKKPKKWEPEDGDWGINHYGDILHIPDHLSERRSFGFQFKTQQAAAAAAKAYRFYHRLYKLAEELNEGWEPDWSDSGQQKFYIWFNTGRAWEVGRIYTSRSPERIYFKSEYAAKKAIQILERGEV